VCSVDTLTNVAEELTISVVRVGMSYFFRMAVYMYRGADKSLARPGFKQATATEDFELHISYL